VNIPGCFEVYNLHHVFNERQAKMMYLVMAGGMLEGKPGFASLCTECGKCVKACPQHLPVPELLHDVQHEMEGVLTKPLSWGLRQMFGFYKWNTLRKARQAA
jgi:predicted aldo/keto reductase-like oxidoreductase